MQNLVLKLKKLYDSNRAIRQLLHLSSAKLYRRSHLKVFLLDVLHRRYESKDSAAHCAEAIKWICQAQDATGTGGVSAGYSFSFGWLPPYPETTGYIIPTFFDYDQVCPPSGQAEYRDRALLMADWLVDIQREEGRHSGGWHQAEVPKKGILHRVFLPDKKPLIFDTAQVIRGLLRAYEETGDTKYLECSQRAGDWILDNQNDDGSWSSYTYLSLPRAHQSYVAWPLAKLSTISGRDKFEIAARHNLDWVLSMQNDDGWFRNNSNSLRLEPLAHVIGYAADGLLECGILLSEDKYVQACQKTAERLLKIYQIKGFHSIINQRNGFLPATFGENWRSKDEHSCLTGNAQISIIWLKLYLLTNDVRYLNTALKMNDDLKATQSLQARNEDIRGGIKGSHPIHGAYMSFCYPCWAAKFFVDALLLEEKALKKVGVK